MNWGPDVRTRTVAAKAAEVALWRIVVHGALSSAPASPSVLSDAEIRKGAAASGAFDFLNDPREDIYTLNDGREV